MQGKLASTLGTLIGIIVIGGLMFMNCVYPIIRGAPTETVNCDHESLTEHCNDSSTFAGFMVELCGRANFSVTMAKIESITIGGPDYEPSDIEITNHCGDVDFVFEYVEGDAPKLLEDFRNIAESDESRLLIDVMQEWHLGEISTNGARRLLLQD